MVAAAARGRHGRLPRTEQTSRPWRIHELTRDFRLEDVWALPTPGGVGDFGRLVQLIASGGRSDGSPRSVRVLWAIRWKVGALLRWDTPDAAAGTALVRSRLPADLHAVAPGPTFAALPFNSIYLLDDEWAVTRIVMKPTHFIGGYAQLSFGFNYYGPTGSQRDEVTVLRKREAEVTFE